MEEYNTELKKLLNKIVLNEVFNMNHKRNRLVYGFATFIVMF